MLTARAFKTDWAASDSTVAVYTFDYGTLAPPVASPPGGTYSEPQLVTLTATLGATIRYTLDGSQPTEASSVYTTPLTVSTTTTLQARAFLPDWTPSLSAVEIYTLTNDATPPTITATVSPAANAAGWHHSDVTVTFACDDPDSGITTCPPPVTVTTEGTGQVVEGMATNGAGLTATASVTINLDKTPPTVTLTAPEDGATVVGPTTAVAGTASDALSGLASATCNGRLADLEGVDASCAVPVRPGRNAIVLVAADVADNVASAGVRVSIAGPRTSLLIVPGATTLLVGHRQALRAVDEYGHTAQAAWSTDEPAVVTIVQDVPPILMAVSPGEAHITATLDTLTASATVFVVGGPSLPAGTAEWTVAPLSAPATSAFMVLGTRTSADVPDVFVYRTGW